MKLRRLMEEWLKTVKDVNGETYEVFVNPSQKELSDLFKEGISYIRFLIDFKEKKVYMWDGDFLHTDMSRRIKKPYRLGGVKDYIWGDGRLRNGKIENFNLSSSRLYKDDAKKIKQSDWLSKYFIDL